MLAPVHPRAHLSWSSPVRVRTALGAALTAALAMACGPSGATDSDSGTDDPDGRLNGDGGPCQGLECFQVDCDGGGTTSISGVVTAPNGTLPLYNATVYVPTGEVGPLPDGLACEQCDAELAGGSLVKTLTDTEGRFVLENMPATQDVPVVIKIGKWRRQIVVPAVPACEDTPLTTEQLRLPATQAEGDMPQIALTTGGSDPLECLLRKIGIADSEFTNPDGGGKIQLFAGGGGSSQYDGGDVFPSVTELWDSYASLADYDVVLASCEGDQTPGNKGPDALAAMDAYTAAGGRMFAEHWHNYWFLERRGAAARRRRVGVPGRPRQHHRRREHLVRARRRPGRLAGQHRRVHHLRRAADRRRPAHRQHRRRQLRRHLDRAGHHAGRHAVGAVLPDHHAADRRARARAAAAMVFSDIHVSSGDFTGVPFPTGCNTTELSPQEKVLAFMFFDIAACVDTPID
jgi:hypothetical protein